MSFVTLSVHVSVDMHVLRDIASTGGWTCMSFVTLSVHGSVDMHVLRDIASTGECGHACPS